MKQNNKKSNQEFKEFDWFHLKNTNQNYWEHFFFGVKWGAFLILTGLLSIIHAIIPWIFTFQTPKNILKIAKKVEKKHPELLNQ